MEKILTIVVPVYNVERYLKQCLESLFVQALEEELEVLIIDDGSTDDSSEIAAHYQSIAPAIFQVIRKENGGHGSALNMGIARASGRYLKTVDGDDWVNSKVLEEFINYLRTADQDIVATNFYWVDSHTGKKGIQQEHPFENIQYGKIYSMDDIAGKTFIKMHSLTIKTELLRKVPYAIDENCFYVDSEFVMFPIPFVETVVFLNSYLYLYRVGRANQSVNIAQMAKNKNQHLKVLKRLLEYYDWVKTQNCSNGQMRYLEKGIAAIYKSQFKVYLSCKYSIQLQSEMEHLDKTIQNNYPEICREMHSRAVTVIRMFHYKMFWPASKVFGVLYKILYR